MPIVSIGIWQDKGEALKENMIITMCFWKGKGTAISSVALTLASQAFHFQLSPHTAFLPAHSAASCVPFSMPMFLIHAVLQMTSRGNASSCKKKANSIELDQKENFATANVTDQVHI